MRIAVFGAGGVGAYFGERLAAAGADVHLIARGRHLDAIRERGLTIRTPEENRTATLPATDDPAEVGPVDVVLFSVKAYDTVDAARRLGPLLREDTAVVSLQNGVDNEEHIAGIVGWPHVVGGAAYILAAIESPAVVVASGPRRLVFGEWEGGPPSTRVAALLELCRTAGVPAEAPPDVKVAVWEKFVMLVAFSAVSASIRLPLGEIRRSPAASRLLEGIATEAWQVGRAAGIALGDDVVERQLGIVAAQKDGAVASLYTDLTTGHRMELDALQGALVRRGRELGVPTPLAETVHAVLEPWAIRNEGSQSPASAPILSA